MHVGGVNSSGGLLPPAIQQQAGTNALSKVRDTQQAQATTEVADEAEQSPDGDERGGGFQAIA